VIEGVNGIFKQEFSGIDQIRNTMLDHIMDDFRIAASLINCFHSNRFSHLNDYNKVNLANEMKLRLNKPNKLESYIKKTKHQINKSFIKLDSVNLEDFPKIDINELKQKVILGSYQIKQAFCYLNEHLSDKGYYEIFVQNNPLIIYEKK
jgi:hypothetical protein